MHRPLPLLLLALAACGDKDATDDSATVGPTWVADVEPLLVNKCGACHQPGGLGPGDWTDYAAASAAAQAIRIYVEAGAMPLPAADPACRDYHGSERMNLTPDEVALLGAWADAGAPQGDPQLSTHPSVPDLSLHDTDVALPMPEAHALQVREDGNEYFCMVLDNPFTETRYINGIDVDLGNPAVVHHMVLAVDQGGDAGREYGTDGHQATFQCADPVVESDWLLLHAWTPGMEPVEFDEGLGLRVNPGDQLVLQMHYFAPPGEPQTDLSTYRLRTVPEVTTEVEMAAIGPTGFRIPAGDSAFSASDALQNRWGRFTIYGAFPHMHLLGSRFDAQLVGNDGEDTCLLSGAYDFDHQMTYMFKEPAEFNRGDRLRMTCTWDNSEHNPRQYNDPPEDVTYGEGTTQEMCFLLFYYSQG